jgi:hypothetical protein
VLKVIIEEGSVAASAAPHGVVRPSDGLHTGQGAQCSHLRCAVCGALSVFRGARRDLVRSAHGAAASLLLPARPADLAIKERGCMASESGDSDYRKTRIGPCNRDRQTEGGGGGEWSR